MKSFGNEVVGFLYDADWELNEAVEQAVNKCIHEGILSHFLQKNRAEAIEVSIFEFDEEKELALLREAERMGGFEQGMERGLRILVNTLKELCLDLETLYVCQGDYQSGRFAADTGRVNEVSVAGKRSRFRQTEMDVLKLDRERRKYMRFEELLQKERREGCAEGREEGREEGRKEGSEQAEVRLTALIAKMTEGGEADKLSRLAEKAFLEEMYRKYGL